MSKKIKSSKKNSPYRRLFGFMLKYKGRFVLAVLSILTASITYAMAPLFMGKATDALGILFGTGIDGSTGKTFLMFLGLMAAAYTMNAILSYVGTWLIVSVTENTIYDLRKQVDHKLSKLPLNYYDTTSYGDILSRITNDVDTVSSSLQQSIYQVLNAVFTIVIIFSIMLNISGLLTFVGLAIVPVALLIASKIANKSQQKFNSQQSEAGNLNGFVEEYYGGHNVVTVFGRQETVINEFEKTNEALYESSRDGQFLAGTLLPLMQNTNNLGYAFL